MPDRATPNEVMQQYVKAFDARDADAVAALYDSAAVFCAPGGVRVEGTAAIRAAVAGTLAIAPTLRLELIEALEAGDLACLTNRWTMEGTAPDGSAIRQEERSVVVLRRQADGGWKIAIDRP